MAVFPRFGAIHLSNFPYFSPDINLPAAASRGSTSSGVKGSGSQGQCPLTRRDRRTEGWRDGEVERWWGGARAGNEGKEDGAYGNITLTGRIEFRIYIELSNIKIHDSLS